MTLVVTLTIRRERLELFRDYERQAAQIMARHGGRIERTVFAPDGAAPDVVREVHVVTFPTPDAFATYRDDPELAALAPMGEEPVFDTVVVIGEEGPSYHSSAQYSVR